MTGRQDGFTLVEVLVAMALAGVAAALVAGSLDVALRVRSGQAERGEMDHRARVTREFLREAVRGLALERQGLGELLTLRAEQAPDGSRSHRLLLSTRGGATFGLDAQVKAVELAVGAGPGGGPGGLVATVLRSVPGGLTEDTLLLMPNAAALRVRLLDGQGEWRSEWADASLAPAAVEFRVLPATGGPAADRLQSLPLQVRVP